VIKERERGNVKAEMVLWKRRREGKGKGKS